MILFKNREEREVALRFYFLIAVILFTIAVVIFVPGLLGPALLSAVFAYLFSPAVDRIEGRYGIPRWASILFVYVLVGLLIYIIYQQSYMGIAAQYQTLSEELPSISSKILQKIDVWEKKYEASSLFLSDIKLVERLKSYGAQLSMDVMSAIPWLLSSLVYFAILVPFFTFFLLKDGKKIKRLMLNMLPNRYLESGVVLIDNINKQMGGFIQARLLETGVLTLIIYIGLLVLGIKYALLLSLIAGVFNLVPYVGPVIGSIPGVAVAYYFGTEQVFLLTILLYFVAQMIDFLVIIPMMVSQRINVHPALVVVLIIVGNSLMGVLGMVLSVPIFCIIKAVVDAVSSRIKVV